MVAITDRVPAIFADARAVHADALQLLEAGDIRNAAEKAWCATKRATDALILARTGTEPAISSETTGGLGGARRRRPSRPSTTQTLFLQAERTARSLLLPRSLRPP